MLVNGVELAVREYGDARAATAVLCIHGSGETAADWAGSAQDLVDSGASPRVITYDRRGWGASSAPEPYTRTTVEEQAHDAIKLLAGIGVESAWIYGDGLGAVIAIDMLVREPTTVSGVVAIEPPLLAFAADAAEGLSADVKLATEASANGGLRDAVSHFERGRLASLFPGSERIMERAGGNPAEPSPAAQRPVSLFAEASAVPAWEIPFSALSEVDAPVSVVTGSNSPAVLERVAASLVPRIQGARHVALSGDPRQDPQLLQHGLLP